MRQPQHTPYLLSLLLAGLLALAGCGGGGNGNSLGGGGCGGGAEVTGVSVCVDEVSPSYNGEATNQVDVVQDNSACTGDAIEYFSDHVADVTISARLVQGATQPPASTSVVFTHYTVDYTPIPIPAASTPGIATLGPIYETIPITVPASPTSSGSATRTLALMTILQKQVFLNDLGYGGAFDGTQRLYSVTYTFYGQDQHGTPVVARGFTQIYLGSYRYDCV